MTDTTNPARYAHEVAPEPKSGAAPLIEHVRYHVARAYALRCTDTDHPGYLQRMEHWVAQAHLALLLYGTHQHNIDHAVPFAHDVLSDGEADEWLWQALTDLELDPDTIRPYGQADPDAAPTDPDSARDDLDDEDVVAAADLL